MTKVVDKETLQGVQQMLDQVRGGLAGIQDQMHDGDGLDEIDYIMLELACLKVTRAWMEVKIFWQHCREAQAGGQYALIKACSGTCLPLRSMIFKMSLSTAPMLVWATTAFFHSSDCIACSMHSAAKALLKCRWLNQML